MSTQTNDPAILTRGLGKSVTSGDDYLTILQSVELRIRYGETVAITGPSGSGKSTLLGLLAGLDTASHGEVHLLGQNLNTLDEDGRAGLRAGMVGFVFQSFQLISGLTALENVMLPLELTNHPQPALRAREVLLEVGLGHRLDHYPYRLSGGEQQRVAIARAWATNPRVLFADEPTGNLDAVTGHKILDLLFDLNRQFSTTMVVVTHDDNLSSRCDRTLNLSEGQLVE